MIPLLFDLNQAERVCFVVKSTLPHFL